MAASKEQLSEQWQSAPSSQTRSVGSIRRQAAAAGLIIQ